MQSICAVQLQQSSVVISECRETYQQCVESREELTGEAAEMLWKSFEELVGSFSETREEQMTHAGHVQRRVTLSFQLTKTVATHRTTV